MHTDEIVGPSSMITWVWLCPVNASYFMNNALSTNLPDVFWLDIKAPVVNGNLAGSSMIDSGALMLRVSGRA